MSNTLDKVICPRCRIDMTWEYEVGKCDCDNDGCLVAQFYNYWYCKQCERKYQVELKDE